jgi:hypothetical protein
VEVHADTGGTMNRQALRVIVRSVCIIVFCVLSGAGSFEAGAQSQNDDSVAKQFVGMWRLVSWPQLLVDGTTKQNSESVGYIIYTDNSHMCFVAMNPNRPKWKSDLTPTTEELVSGLGNGSFYAYCATVEVHAKEGFILHHIEIDKSPNLVGGTRKRWFTFQGPNRVALRIDPSENNPSIVESTLIWERIPK